MILRIHLCTILTKTLRQNLSWIFLIVIVMRPRPLTKYNSLNFYCVLAAQYPLFICLNFILKQYKVITIFKILIIVNQNYSFKKTNTIFLNIFSNFIYLEKEINFAICVG